ncbi:MULTISPECIES: GtrA family protein [Halarchaeum]|uniref:Sugar translocase n=2 Tax=Halarchaeum TaxID=744724 RepID=A0A830GGP5_9EURY|nr:GtrA family protein [Halarchaeum nitratireducens]GGN26365.1 sugar translocase [Halarchaeum nitratireducens]
MNRLQSLARGGLLGRYLSVGVTGASVESIVVLALTATALTGSLVAKAVGAEISISLMFVLNDRWTFADAGAAGIRSFVDRFLRSHAVRAVGLAVGFVVLIALTDFVTVSVRLAGLELWPTLANLIGIGTGFAVNYIGEGLFTWNPAET